MEICFVQINRSTFWGMAQEDCESKMHKFFIHKWTEIAVQRVRVAEVSVRSYNAVIRCRETRRVVTATSWTATSMTDAPGATTTRPGYPRTNTLCRRISSSLPQAQYYPLYLQNSRAALHTLRDAARCSGTDTAAEPLFTSPEVVVRFRLSWPLR